MSENTKVEYTDLSISLTKSLSKSEKKEEGIYFSPKRIIKKIIDIISYECEANGFKIKTILEPSCGSCEFINELDNSFNKLEITGVERNENIYDKIKTLKWVNNNVELIESCFFEYYNRCNKNSYDLIVGNPPYFVMKKKDVPDEFKKIIDGRPNIYIIFLMMCLELLKNDGILSFILPNNFLNCLYYEKVRKIIYDKYTILDISICSDSEFLETEQTTCVITVKKIKTNNDNNNVFSILLGDNIIFNTKQNIEKIKELIKGTKTLSDIGMKVFVGKVVWNEVKSLLTDDNSKCRLIYSGDIKNNEIILTKYNNSEKKNYINKTGETSPLLVVNRGYGRGKYCFQYGIIDFGEKEYLVENHLICIDWKDSEKKKKLSKDKIFEQYDEIIKSFINPKTEQFINLYFENNAINTTELETIMPLYIN